MSGGYWPAVGGRTELIQWTRNNTLGPVSIGAKINSFIKCFPTRLLPFTPPLHSLENPNYQTAPGFTLLWDIWWHISKLNFQDSIESEYSSPSSGCSNNTPKYYIYIPKHVRPFWIIIRAGWLLCCTLQQPNDNLKMWATKTLSYRHSYRSRLIIPNTNRVSPPVLFCSFQVIEVGLSVFLWRSSSGRCLKLRKQNSAADLLQSIVRDRDEEMGNESLLKCRTLNTTKFPVIVWYLHFILRILSIKSWIAER